MLVRDALLAFAHFALIFLLAGLLYSELALYRKRMTRSTLSLLGRIDLAYGIAAGLVAASGISRMIWGLKGTAFYTSNPLFWAKMAVFGLIAVLSLPPTFHYLRIAKHEGDEVTVADGTFRRMRGMLFAEAILLLTLPLFAAFMARGL
jgi:putative membrane protein